MGNSLPTNHFKSEALSALVFGSISIHFPDDMDLSNPDGRTYNIRCEMGYLGSFRNGQHFEFHIPCTYSDHTLRGTITLMNGQIFSINAQHSTFGGKHIFNGTYASINPADSGTLYYEVNITSA